MLQKSFCLSLAAVLLLNTGFAATPASHKWEFGGGALYLKPLVRYWDVGLGFDGRSAPPSDYEWGGNLSTAYFYNEASDVNLNWQTYSNTARDFSSQPTYFAEFIVSGRSDQTSSYKNNFSLLNLEFGHALRHKGMTLRAHAGGQYLNHDFAYQLVDKERATGSSSSTWAEYNTNSRYQGGGPRAGLELSHDLKTKNWSVFAHGASAVLLGQTKSSLFSQGLSSRYRSFYQSVRKSRTIAELGVQLGLAYQTQLQNHQVSVSGGWLLNRFFNLIQSNPSSAEGAALSLSGPFVNVKISEDVCSLSK